MSISNLKSRRSNKLDHTKTWVSVFSPVISTSTWELNELLKLIAFIKYTIIESMHQDKSMLTIFNNIASYNIKLAKGENPVEPF